MDFSNNLSKLEKWLTHCFVNKYNLSVKKSKNAIKKHVYQVKKTLKQAVFHYILGFIYNLDQSIKLLIINIIGKLSRNIIIQTIMQYK